MEKAKAIELLKDIITNKVSIHGGNEEAIRMAIAALEKAPTALDHIHNVVAEREYQRGYKQAKEEYDHKLTEIKSRIKDHYYNKGYKQGKADANYPEFPDSWIPVKAHPATDEEREIHPDIDYWFDCEMPDDGQEILVTVKHKNWLSVEKDVCYVDSCYGLDSGYDWLDDIIAWMPLPEPYKEGE